MRRALIAILATGLMPVICLPASAHSHKVKRRHVPHVERDCTPINGFYGYYGNPWCDTGSSRPPDIDHSKISCTAVSRAILLPISRPLFEF